MELDRIVPPGESGAFQVGDRRKTDGLGSVPESHRHLLDDAVFAALATVNPNGTVQLTPVWADTDGPHVLVNTVRGRRKDRNLRARRRASLLLMDPENPYRWLSILAQVDEILDEDDPERGQQASASINAMSKAYTGDDTYQMRDPGGEVRSLFRLVPTRVTVFG